MRPSIRILLLTVPLLTGCELPVLSSRRRRTSSARRSKTSAFPAAIPIPGTVSQTFNFPVEGPHRHHSHG